MAKTIACMVCGKRFKPKRRESKCCSRSCWFQRGTPKCREAGCDEPNLANGLCRFHYHQERYERPQPVLTHCSICRVPIYRCPVAGRRHVCSERCKAKLVLGRFPEEGKEMVGPISTDGSVTLARILARRNPPKRSNAKSGPRFLACTCGWCGERFIFDMRTTGTLPSTCSSRCRRSAAKDRARKARGQFSISPTLRRAIYERDNWTCQLCGEPVDSSLPTHHRWAATLDHIECQAWTLIPDHSEGNLRLAHRMCNSIRGDESWLTSELVA